VKQGRRSQPTQPSTKSIRGSYLLVGVHTGMGWELDGIVSCNSELRAQPEPVLGDESGVLSLYSSHLAGQAADRVRSRTSCSAT